MSIEEEYRSVEAKIIMFCDIEAGKPIKGNEIRREKLIKPGQTVAIPDDVFSWKFYREVSVENKRGIRIIENGELAHQVFIGGILVGFLHDPYPSDDIRKAWKNRGLDQVVRVRSREAARLKGPFHFRAFEPEAGHHIFPKRTHHIRVPDFVFGPKAP